MVSGELGLRAEALEHRAGLLDLDLRIIRVEVSHDIQILPLSNLHLAAVDASYGLQHTFLLLRITRLPVSLVVMRHLRLRWPDNRLWLRLRLLSLKDYRWSQTKVSRA